MKTLSIERFQALPSGFQESISERSAISAAITNCKTFLKYFRQCEKYFKETNEQHWIKGGHNSLVPYYNQLLSIEHLAIKYHELWHEEFCKIKLQCEKALNK